jgi:hypothetical protein
MPKQTILDQGQQNVQFKIGEREGFVVLDFGKPTTWIALSPDDMIDLATRLALVAEKLKGQQQVSLT